MRKAQVSAFFAALFTLATGVAFAQQQPPAPAPAPPPPAPAPAPAPGTAPPPAYPQQPPAYPPPAYPPPAYPPPAYPPPAYPPQAYPPQAYPPPVYPPPPEAPAVPQYPDDAAVQASPFIDALVFGTIADQRFTDLLMFGGQAGAYLAGRIRLAARLVLTTDPNVDGRNYFQNTVTELPNLLYGGTIGVIAVKKSKFVFSPGITLNRTDVADYGTMVAASLPFEWVMRGGVRLGFEGAFGRGVGGKVEYECTDAYATNCTIGQKYTEDRKSGVVVLIGFQVGFGFGYPEPTMPAPGQSPP